MNRAAERLAWLVNTIGLVVYLIWLTRTAGSNLFFSQEGVLYLLPCLPFFFVFFALIHRRRIADTDQLPKSDESNGSEPV